jgi:hypothetical protein
MKMRHVFFLIKSVNIARLAKRIHNILNVWTVLGRKEHDQRLLVRLGVAQLVVLQLSDLACLLILLLLLEKGKLRCDGERDTLNLFQVRCPSN